MEITINTPFTFGQTVYLKTDKEQSERMIIRMIIHNTGHILYDVVCGSSTSWHYEMELSAEKNQLLSFA